MISLYQYFAASVSLSPACYLILDTVTERPGSVICSFQWCSCWIKPSYRTGSMYKISLCLLCNSAERLCSRQSRCSSAPSHFPLGGDEGVKSWAVSTPSSAECSFIHLRCLKRSRGGTGAETLWQQEKISSHMMNHHRKQPPQSLFSLLIWSKCLCVSDKHNTFICFSKQKVLNYELWFLHFRCFLASVANVFRSTHL